MKETTTKTEGPTVAQIASCFHVTPEQVRNQFSRNAIGLRKMEATALSTGRKVNGYTAQQLGDFAAMAERRAAN